MCAVLILFYFNISFGYSMDLLWGNDIESESIDIEDEDCYVILRPFCYLHADRNFFEKFISFFLCNHSFLD